MNILHVMPYSPHPPIFGGALRMYHLLKHLVEHHQVTLVYFGTPDTTSKLKEHFNSHLHNIHAIPFPWPCRYRRLGQLYAHWINDSFFQLVGRSKEMQATLDRLFSDNDYDLVQVEFCFMGNYHLRTDAVKILDAHNVEYDNYRRMALHTSSPLRKWHYNHEYEKLFHEEVATCLKHDAVFVTSARDKAILDTDVPSVPKFIVPNGVDTSYFRPTQQPHEAHSIVFTGMMGYVPNYDGMLYFLDKIFPLIQRELPQVKIYIVGNRPPKELLMRAAENVVVTGYVDDVRPYVWRSAVYVVPLRMGGGTRLKVLEAMAMKKPIVTTSIGCEGIDVKHRDSVLIADDPREFAESVIELLRDKSLQNRLLQKGYDLVHAQYEWSVIGKQLDLMYPQIVQSASIIENEPMIYE